MIGAAMTCRTLRHVRLPRVGLVGQMADYVEWQTRTFGSWRQFSRREQLWSQMAARLRPGAPVLALEFGVAWGYATSYWLSRLLAGREAVEWHGFDRFTGLPRAWRRFPEGAFDAGGQPPEMDDPRVTWHVGDVEVTLASQELDRPPGWQRVILFDLDLYEPTICAWEAVAPRLAPGDLLYFDEALDHDERRVLDERVLPGGSYRHLGSTALSLALEVETPPAVPRRAAAPDDA